MNYLLLQRPCIRQLYKISTNKTCLAPTIALSFSTSDDTLWHQRLGHPHFCIACLISLQNYSLRIPYNVSFVHPSLPLKATNLFSLFPKIIHINCFSWFTLMFGVWLCNLLFKVVFIMFFLWMIFSIIHGFTLTSVNLKLQRILWHSKCLSKIKCYTKFKLFELMAVESFAIKAWQLP